MKGLQFNYDTTSTYDYYDKLIDIYCTLKQLDLAPQVKQVLRFFCLKGVNKTTRTYLVNKGIVASIQVYRNIQTELYKKGLLKREGKIYVVIDSLNVQNIGFSLELKVQLVVKQVEQIENNNA